MKSIRSYTSFEVLFEESCLHLFDEICAVVDASIDMHMQQRQIERTCKESAAFEECLARALWANIAKDRLLGITISERQKEP